MARSFFSEITNEIRQIIEMEEPFLNSLDKKCISLKTTNQNRSIKQIVGHMIDSASNNIHRIVHLQYDECPLIFPNYASNGNNDRWIAIQNYKDEDWSTLIQLWKYSNLHIIHVIENINTDKIHNKWLASPNGEEVSLEDMVIDYPRHLKLHINEIHQMELHT